MHKLLTRQHIDFNCHVHGTKITAGLCKVMQITTIFILTLCLIFPCIKFNIQLVLCILYLYRYTDIQLYHSHP